MKSISTPSCKSAPINRPPRRKRAFSKFAKMTTKPAHTSVQASIEDIASLPPYLALPELYERQRVADRRSHQFIRSMRLAGYRVAARLAQDPVEWAKFCKDPFWKGEKQPPKIAFPQTALRHAYIRIFGKGDSRAYQSFAKLKQAFESETSPEQIEQELDQVPVDKPAKDGVTQEKRKPIVIESSGTFEGGIFDAGRKSVPFTVPQGYTAHVRLEVNLTRPRGRRLQGRIRSTA